MPPGISRREVLLAVGATAALPLVASATATTVQAACSEQTAIEAELEQRRDDLAAELAELEALPDQIADLHRFLLETVAARAVPRFPGATRQEALAVGRAARESVVALDVVERFGQGTATAWFVTDHTLLTNSHNVDSEFEHLYGVTASGESFEASLVDRVESQEPDVALLETDYSGVPLSTGDATSLAVDDPLVQVGHPAGFGFWVITLGGFVRQPTPDEVHATIPGLAGNSGSPILDLDGGVVAMTYAGKPGEIVDPEPADDVVRIGSMAVDPFTSAVSIEAAMERMEAWT